MTLRSAGSGDRCQPESGVSELNGRRSSASRNDLLEQPVEALEQRLELRTNLGHRLPDLDRSLGVAVRIAMLEQLSRVAATDRSASSTGSLSSSAADHQAARAPAGELACDTGPGSGVSPARYAALSRSSAISWRSFTICSKLRWIARESRFCSNVASRSQELVQPLRPRPWTRASNMSRSSCSCSRCRPTRSRRRRC